MVTSKVLYEKRGPVAYVTLNRPEVKNAIDVETHERLCEIWADFRDDPAMRVAVITGAGDAFTAGADLKTHAPEWQTVGPMVGRDRIDDGLWLERVTKDTAEQFDLGTPLGFRAVLRDARERAALCYDADGADRELRCSLGGLQDLGDECPGHCGRQQKLIAVGYGLKSCNPRKVLDRDDSLGKGL